MRPGLRKIDQNPHSGRSLDRQVRCALASPAQDDQLLLEQEILRHHRSSTTGATELRGHDGEVKQGEQEVPHLRVTVGQTWGAAQRCRILDSAREFSIRDAQPRIGREPVWRSISHGRLLALVAAPSAGRGDSVAASPVSISGEAMATNTRPRTTLSPGMAHFSACRIKFQPSCPLELSELYSVQK